MKVRAILLAEDEEMVRDVIQAMLSLLGYRVLAARNCLEAIELFLAHTNEIDLAIIDLNMPDLDGFECLKRIREIAPVPALLSTGGGALQDEQILQTHNIQGILLKPVKLDDLKKTLERALLPSTFNP